MFRVIIAGGRDFQDFDLLSKTMDHLLSNINDIVALFHDLSKVNFYASEKRNRKNAQGKWESYDAYTINMRHVISIVFKP